jgi:hydrogenase maturation protease
MSTVVIGVGNPYRSDDGVGPAVVDLLRGMGVPESMLARSLGETTELMDLWEDTDLAIVIDAVRAEPAHPGRVHRLVVPELDTGRTRAASSHGLDLGEAVELARILGRVPARLMLYAIEVSAVGLGEGLSAPVADAATHVAEEIAAQLHIPQRAVVP